MRYLTHLYNMDETQNMQKQIDALAHTLHTHKHLGNDLTQKLNAASITYGGRVDASATSAVLPTGWTVSVSAGHVYTVTHNLNTTSYAVTVSTVDSGGATHFVPLFVFSANTFTVELDTTGGSAANTAFNFMLTLIT